MLDTIFSLLPLAARLGRTGRDVQNMAFQGVGYGAEWLGNKIGLGGVGRELNTFFTTVGEVNKSVGEWSASVGNLLLDEEDHVSPTAPWKTEKSRTTSSDLQRSWNQLSGQSDLPIDGSSPGVVTSVNEAGKKKKGFWDTITRPVSADDPLENRFTTSHLYFGNVSKKGW